MKTKPFLLFDLGGTLVDLRGIVVSMAERLRAIRVRSPVPLAMAWATEIAKQLPAAQGRKFRAEREIAADVLGTLLERRGRLHAREESARLVVDAWNGFVRISSFQQDVSTDWLRDLRPKVARLGLVTDGDAAAVEAVLSHLGLSDLFDSITVSETVRSYKPHARIYRAALKALLAKPEESLFVSDAVLDLHGAAELGIAGAWIPRGLLPEQAAPPPGTTILSSLRDVEQLVDRFAKFGRFSSR